MAILTLAVGIGSTTAVYSIADAVLFRPLPFENAERVVRLHSFNTARGFDFINVSYPDFTEWRDETAVFDSAAAFRMRDVDLAGADEPLRLRVGTVGADFFRVLRARPVVGRTFQIDDHDPANELATVLSEGLWRGRFGGDTSIVGQSVRLDGVPHTVVGVVDETGQWPLNARAWVPVRFVMPPTARSDHSWEVIARLAPDTSIGAATTRISTLARRASASQPEERDRGWDAAATPLLSLAGDDLAIDGVLLLERQMRAQLAGPRFVTWVLSLFGVVSLLLATSGVYGLASFALASRTHEIGIRMALGASQRAVRMLIVRQSAPVLIAGAALGIAGAAAIARIAASRFAGLAGFDLMSVAAVTALLVSVALTASHLPARRATRIDPLHALRQD
ncbi:MAG: ABC transporter permease [Vicinamibacterales bacterium]|nr:ABC transporter permease [Vicinamibacterales bacterium]